MASTNPVGSPLSSVPTEWPDEKRAASDLNLALAQMLDQQGSADDAIAAYEKIYASDSSNPALARRLAVLLDRKGQPERAETYYQQALRKSPDDSTLLTDYGYHCYLQRRWTDAETHLRRALELDHSQSRAHGNLALVLARTQRVDEALAQFSQAGCSPADAHANVAFALAAEAQLEHAEQQYRLALQADPQHKRARDALSALDQARRQVAKAG